VGGEVFGEEAEDHVTVRLQEQVFVAVAAVGGGGEVLGAVYFDDHAGGGGEEVHFQFAVSVEGDGEFCVEREFSSEGGQGFETAKKECLACAAVFFFPARIERQRQSSPRLQSARRSQEDAGYFFIQMRWLSYLAHASAPHALPTEVGDYFARWCRAMRRAW
jgi:hypothetical protein